jgi:hypothetical protein
MSIAKTLPPKPSFAKLHSALEHLIPLKDRRKRWMRIRLGAVRRKHIFYPHPIYNVRLLDLLARQAFGATLRRVAWMYFIRNPEGQLASVEISIVGGKHKNFRLTEGPFVSNVLNAIKRSRNDPRLRRRSFQLRSVRLESLHGFALWFRASDRTEFWIPVTPIGAHVAPGQWLSRTEFADLLLTEAKRVVATHERASQLAKRA